MKKTTRVLSNEIKMLVADARESWIYHFVDFVYSSKFTSWTSIIAETADHDDWGGDGESWNLEKVFSLSCLDRDEGEKGRNFFIIIIRDVSFRY